MPRIAIAGFQHETNCFIPERTDFSYFLSHRDRPPLVRGDEIFRWLDNASFAMSGFLAAPPKDAELLPLLWTSGGAGGIVTQDAFERIAAELIIRLADSLPVDAIYLDLHGAMVTEELEDGDGELLRRIRAVVGETVPIIASLDYHANVTPLMLQHADALVAYRTYPHTDRPETGARSAAIVERMIRSGRPAGRTLWSAPFLIPLTDQSTLVDPSRRVVEETTQLDPGVICLSYLAGFPSADLHDCGPSVVAYAESQDQADAAVGRLAASITALESAFAAPTYDVDAGIALAIARAREADKPVVVADTQDNPGAGGSSDTTGVLEALLRHKAPDATVGLLFDPDAAAAAYQAGVGQEIELALGGRFGPAGVRPLQGRFRVLALQSGSFKATGPVSGGRQADLGAMACLQIEGVKIVVTSKRMQAHDAAPFRRVGIEPSEQAILVVKSTCHFRAEFEPMADRVIVVVAPGGFASDPADLPYRRLRAGVRLRPNGPAHQTGRQDRKA